MPEASLENVRTLSAETSRSCECCGASLEGKRRHARFCSADCRRQSHRERAPQGVVTQVRRLARGRVAVTLHFEPEDAERALRLMPGGRAIVAVAHPCERALIGADSLGPVEQ